MLVLGDLLRRAGQEPGGGGLCPCLPNHTFLSSGAVPPKSARSALPHSYCLSQADLVPDRLRGLLSSLCPWAPRKPVPGDGEEGGHGQGVLRGLGLSRGGGTGKRRGLTFTRDSPSQLVASVSPPVTWDVRDLRVPLKLTLGKPISAGRERKAGRE